MLCVSLSLSMSSRLRRGFEPEAGALKYDNDIHNDTNTNNNNNNNVTNSTK